MGDNSQSTQQQQQQQSNPWAPTIPSLQNLISKISGNSTAVTPGQSSAVGNLQTAAGNIPNLGTDVSSLWSKFLQPSWLDPYTNPALAPAITSLNQQIGTGIASQFAGAGRDPSGNALAPEAIARGEAQAEAPLLVNQFNSNVASAENAATAGPGSTAAAFTTPAQAQLSAANLGYQLPFQNIANPENLLLPIAGLGGQATSSGTSTTTQPVNPWTTGAGIGLGLLSLSDENLKENIEPAGLLHNGLKIYRYNFKGSPRKEIGVLAQEVEKVKPDAVVNVGLWHGGPSVKMVDYDKATKPTAMAA